MKAMRLVRKHQNHFTGPTYPLLTADAAAARLGVILASWQNA
jgi:hypothetical protein